MMLSDSGLVPFRSDKMRHDTSEDVSTLISN